MCKDLYKWYKKMWYIVQSENSRKFRKKNTMCKVKGCNGWWWKGETIVVESSLRVARLATTVCWPGCVLQAQCPVTRNPRRTQSRCSRVRLRMYLKCVHRRISVSCMSRVFSRKMQQAPPKLSLDLPTR